MIPLQFNKIIDSETARILGKKLDSLMRGKGIDQVTLGEKIHKEQSTISKILTASKKKNELSDFYEISIGLGLSDKDFELLYIDSDKERLGIGTHKVNEDPHDIIKDGLIALYGGDMKKVNEVYEFAKFKEGQK